MYCRIIGCSLLGLLACLNLLAPAGRSQPLANPPAPGTNRGMRDRSGDSPEATHYGGKWALIIGINYTEPDRPDMDRMVVPKLANAENDASSLRDLLAAHYGYDKEKEIVLLTGKDATREAIRDRLSSGFLGDRSRVEADHSILVFFAGHGDRIHLQDGSNEQVGVLFPADVRVKDGKPVRASTLSLQQDVVDLLRESPARHKLVILDSCYSGDIFSQQLPSRSRDDDHRREAHLFRSPAFQAIASSRTDQTAADGRNGHSPFTESLLTALKTMPNRADNRQYLTVTDLFRFMYAEGLQRLPDGQSPDLRSLTRDDGEFRFFPTGDFAAYLPQAQDYKLLQALVPGEYGNWWFDEIPWMIPSLRLAILSETTVTRTVAAEKITPTELWKSARRLRNKLSKDSNSSLGQLRLKHLEALHQTEQGHEPRESYPDIIKDLQTASAELEGADLHLLAVLQHNLGDKEALESYRKALEKYREEQKAVGGTQNEALIALCHADRAYYKLNVAGDGRGAADDFARARKSFGELAPPPFQVFVLCREADAWQQKGAWGVANDRLALALHVAEKWDPQHTLVAHALSRRGWASMEQWRFHQALEEFDNADKILAAKAGSEARLARLDVSMGTALARRFLGDADGAINAYRKISRDLGQELNQLRQDAEAGTNLAELQARLLPRWVDALESLADCNLFGDPGKRDLSEANDDLRLALRVCYRIPGSAGKKIKARLMYKQALTLSLAKSTSQDLDLAHSYCKQATELAGSWQGEEARGLEYYARLTPALVALFQSATGTKTEDFEKKRACLAELRRTLESLRETWQLRNSREDLELLVFAASVLVEESIEADRYETLADTEMLLGFCRKMLAARAAETCAYLRPFYDTAMTAKLRLRPRHVKELLEVQREATRGQPWNKAGSGAAVLALYVLGEKCYLFLDVPRGPSKYFCLADDYPSEEIRSAVQSERLLLPREVVKELRKLPGLGVASISCWWRDPLIEPQGPRGVTAGRETAAQSSGFHGVAESHFPFKLPEGLQEIPETTASALLEAENTSP